MAAAIDRETPNVAGKAALAMEAFSRALRQLPTIIADNAGLDSSELVAQMRAAHAGKLCFIFPLYGPRVLRLMQILLCLYDPVLLCFYSSMLICLYAYMLICLYAPMLLCFYASMLLCFYAPMLLCPLQRVTQLPALMC
jgi:hypothetical protein